MKKGSSVVRCRKGRPQGSRSGCVVLYDPPQEAAWKEDGFTESFVGGFVCRALGIMPVRLSCVTILLSGDSRVRTLNRTFRKMDKPTNVLSFPDTCDIIVSHETASRECSEQRKALLDHVRHLLVHSLLHLAGYDHKTPGEARIMEQIEIDTLDAFHIKNPYECP